MLESPPLIPREVLFGNPDRASVQISHDGRHLGWLAPWQGVMNVWVAPTDDPTAAEAITHDQGRGIRAWFWAHTHDRVLYLQDKDGDENWRLYSVDVASHEAVNLTPFDGVQARVQQTSHRHPREVLVGLNDRDPQLHDLWRIDVASGERERVLENEGYAGFVTDDDFAVRFAERFRPDGGLEVLQRGGDGAFEPYLTIPHEDSLTTSLGDFDKSGRRLYLLDSRGRDTAALTVLDLDSGEQKVIAQHARADISAVMLHPTEKTLQAWAATHKRTEWHPLTDAIADDLDALREVSRGDVAVISRTLDDQTWVVAYVVDDGPTRYYLYRRGPEPSAEFLFTNRDELADLPLTRMHALELPARDGRTLVSYLSLPLDALNDRDDERPREPVGLVLYVHGGPWARDSWGFNPIHQWLANRGYAVLSVNYRGSTGFGKDFINAADLEWAGTMHDDLIDAVDWAIAEEITVPSHVGIMGGSYGGYATLVGLAFTPDRFVCGVDIVGPSNLLTLLESIPPYWGPLRQQFVDRVGNPDTDDGRELLLSRSPLTRVDRIRKPLLIGQGANDPRVKQGESDQIVEAMKAKRIPVTYVLYPDEGHGFQRPENRLSFFAISEAFLSEHMGGRFEPVGDAFEGSSVQVPEGADQVPGLEDED